MLSIALAGKPNAGKSTFFAAATLADVEIASYPFTTIDANHGVTYVTAKCPCQELGVDCGNCRDGVRFIPVALIDVAGLVPEAHLGRGLGNEFLDNLRGADAVIQVIDASGATDLEGKPGRIGEFDPLEEIDFFRREVAMWLFGILKRNWDRLSRKIQSSKKTEEVIAGQLEGAGVTREDVKAALTHINSDIRNWSDEELIKLSEALREESMPILLAANKIDLAPPGFLDRLKQKGAQPVCAAAELALRKADRAGAIKYTPGTGNFKILKANEAQHKALLKIKSVLDTFKTTGLQECLNKVVFDILDMIVVYPVEDENKLTDKKGRILPDALLLKKGSTPRHLAYQVHTDIGQGFLYAIDARTKMRLGEKHQLKDNDVIKIVAVKH